MSSEPRSAPQVAKKALFLELEESLDKLDLSLGRDSQLDTELILVNTSCH